jgi:hypothetical protein
MKMEKIIVFYDGETWEILTPDIAVMTITDDGMTKICDGERPEDLDECDVISRAPLTDLMLSPGVGLVTEKKTA